MEGGERELRTERMTWRRSHAMRDLGSGVQGCGHDGRVAGFRGRGATTRGGVFGGFGGWDGVIEDGSRGEIAGLGLGLELLLLGIACGAGGGRGAFGEVGVEGVEDFAVFAAEGVEVSEGDAAGEEEGRVEEGEVGDWGWGGQEGYCCEGYSS